MRRDQNAVSRGVGVEELWPEVFSKFVFRWDCEDERHPDHGKLFEELIEPLAGVPCFLLV
jgi:hypothetical protein